MGAHFADLAFVHDDDFVGALHRREPVGDDQGCSSLDHAVERVAHAEFGFGIDAGSGFVENQDLRFVGQGAGERDELLLPGGKRGAAFADFFVESLGQGADEVGQVYVFGGLLDVLRPGCASFLAGYFRRWCR